MCTKFEEFMLKFNELESKTVHLLTPHTSPRTSWDQTAVTSSTRMNGRQIHPTSIR